MVTRAMRVLIVDDDETTLLLARRRLEAEGHRVEVRSAAIGTTNAVRTFRPDVVLVDVGLPAMTGYELAKLLHSSSPNSRLVLFSGRDRTELSARAREVGAIGFIHKSDSARIVPLLEALLKNSRRTP